MFLIPFILFFKFLPIISIECMTKKSNSILTAWTEPDCKFNLKIDESFPDDQDITDDYDCETKSHHLIHSCFASISIDYNDNTMEMKFSDVHTVKTLKDPYDAMLVLYSDTDEVIQYKIEGNLQNLNVKLITRIECKTYDNCALDKLRKILPNLIHGTKRLPTFQKISKLLNEPEPQKGTQLQSMDDNNAQITCINNQDYCEMYFSDTIAQKHCVNWISSTAIDFEYRFNNKDDKSSTSSDRSDKATKSIYKCKKSNCNSEELWGKVDELVHMFVDPSLVKNEENKASIAPKSPVPHQANSKLKPKKNSGYSNISSFYLLILSLISIFFKF